MASEEKSNSTGAQVVSAHDASDADAREAALAHDPSDADLRELGELAAAESVVTLAVDWDAAPVVPGQVVTLTLGIGAAGIVSGEARIEALRGPAADGHSQELVLRIQGPLRRQQRRFDVRLPLDMAARRTLRISPGSEPEPMRSRVLDIGAGGMLLQTTSKVATGDRLVVAFTLPGDGQELRVALVVRYSRQPNEEELYRWESGCQFQALRPADRERIARYIFSQQRDAAYRQRALAA